MPVRPAGAKQLNRPLTVSVVTVMSTASWPRAHAADLLRFAGAGLLVATAAIHLDLYLTGYRTIPTIGWLFLLQVIAGFGLAAALLATRSWLVPAAGAGFALSTLGGYLLSVQFGLFGFREVRTTAGVVAGLIEVAAFAALAVLAALPGARQAPVHRASSALDRYVTPAVVGVAVVALALLGGALAGAGSAPGAGVTVAAGDGVLRTETIGSTTVLANAQGRTLYTFAPDTSTTSACYGSCAQYWPPVPGPDHAGNGVTGTLGTIRRTNGSLQETYDGHPLYTYIGDSGPGQAHGNGLDLNGGLWREVVIAS